MTPDLTTVPSLTTEGCQSRQSRLRNELRARQLDGALLTGSRLVHYFTGYWHREIFARAVWIETDGPVVLAVPARAENPVTADDVRVFAASRSGTLVDDQSSIAIGTLQDRFAGAGSIGVAEQVPVALLGDKRLCDITPALATLRRTKDPDEVAMLRFALHATEAAYRHAAEIVREGLCERRLWSEMLATAACYVGETLGEFGNDFQVGALGSAPRQREMQAGEAAVLDLSVVVRGYAGDMCRSFIVGGQPSARQQVAHARIVEVLRQTEQRLCPGIRCAELHEQAIAMLDGFEGWSFKHHLGHGIGLCNHESPRLNRAWDDVLQVGDVITLEPGLYGEDLRAGLRVEEAYYLGPQGPEKLTTFPISLDSIARL